MPVETQTGTPTGTVTRSFAQRMEAARINGREIAAKFGTPTAPLIAEPKRLVGRASTNKDLQIQIAPKRQRLAEFNARLGKANATTEEIWASGDPNYNQDYITSMNERRELRTHLDEMRRIATEIREAKHVMRTNRRIMRETSGLEMGHGTKNKSIEATTNPTAQAARRNVMEEPATKQPVEKPKPFSDYEIVVSAGEKKAPAGIL